jgi:phenylalanyl-tRNA synthetase alpha chain
MTSSDLRERFEQARDQGLDWIETAADLAALEAVKVKVFGRKAPLAQARGALRDVSEDERRDLGMLANEVRGKLDHAFRDKQERFQTEERARRWGAERLDVTLPADGYSPGALHLLTRTLWEIVDVFIGLGYRVIEGPEVEYSHLNFDALNTPYEHPSRSPTDTFFVAGTDEKVCLRTQTSPVQVRAMQASEGPLYVVVPGRTYRRDALDATHLAQFTQMEGLAVDEGITMGDLKGTLEAFAHELFGGNLEIRLRPHFFPFTEPSAEMDVQCFVCMGTGCRVCKRSGYIEVLGCGMVHPNVLENGGYDPERYTGFAFGMGIERIAALAHGIADIRVLYDNDLRFATSFGGFS